tara:strand:+ start:928 stop:1638 length:711 start_codon:yes stop_codon:yes gene_type:complete
VAIDAVGTLFAADPPVDIAYFEIGRLHGSRLDQQTIGQRLGKAFAKLSGDDRSLETSEAAEEAWWKEVVSEVFRDSGIDDRLEHCFSDLFHHFGMSASWRCYADVGPTLEWLVASGIDFVVASNFDQRLHDVCRDWPLFQQARAMVVSSEVGWKKPAAGFYESVLVASGCEARHVLMVGDDLRNDVRGALACGLQAVHLDRDGTGDARGHSGGQSGRHAVIRSLAELPRLLGGFPT